MQRRELGDEIDQASRLLRDAFVPFKLNVAALGNLVPQLHVHVIARFENDPAWPAPVWGRVPARPYTPEDLVERVNTLNDFLRACCKQVGWGEPTQKPHAFAAGTGAA